MKVLFSLYYENYSAQERTIYFSKWVETDWAYTKIEQYLNIKDGFHSQCIIGNNLSFWDIYSFYDDIESIAKRIDHIPANGNNIQNHRLPTFIRIQEYNQIALDKIKHRNTQSIFICSIKQFECGANGYEAIVAWMASHPFEMIFIAGVVYDSVKWLIRKLFNKKSVYKEGVIFSKPLVFQVKKFYKRFGELINTAPSDCQTLDLRKSSTTQI